TAFHTAEDVGCNLRLKSGGTGRNRTADQGFADPCLTTWLPCLTSDRSSSDVSSSASFMSLSRSFSSDISIATCRTERSPLPWSLFILIPFQTGRTDVPHSEGDATTS